MIEKKIKALENFNFRNELGSWMLTEGEVAVVEFKNQKDFEAHLATGLFEAAPHDLPTGRNIQILYKKEDSVPAENRLMHELELTGNLEKLKEEVKAEKVDPLYNKEVRTKKTNPWITAIQNGNSNREQELEEAVRGNQSQAASSGNRTRNSNSAGNSRKSSGKRGKRTSKNSKTS